MITRDEHFDYVHEIAVAQRQLDRLKNIPKNRLTDGQKSKKKRLKKRVRQLKKELKERTPTLPGF
jgi:hypothetical protein